jgi:radical SAM superfamily enzyme YgiQ (UPF0313 family)
MYLAAVVKKLGHEAVIVDFRHAEAWATNWFPDAIGYSVMTGDQQLMLGLNNMIRRGLPSGLKQPVSIFGGPHATFFPEDFMGKDLVEYTVQGEGENFMARFLESNFTYPTIDSIPFPDRTNFAGHKIRDFITSRGCPFNCSYCYNDRWSQLYPGSPVKTRLVNNVVAEITAVNPDFVYFQDSCFGVNISWLREFSGMYRRLLNIPFHCHLRPSQVDEERAILLNESHCVSVRIALETVNPRLLKLLNREKTDLVQVKDAVRLLKKWNIRLMIQNMIGLPTGTIEDDLQTLEFNIRCRPAYGWVSIFQPYPGTALGDLSKKEGWYKGDYSEITDCFFDGSVMEFNDLYKEQLQVLQKIWALSVETGIMPTISKLCWEAFPKMVHRMTRTVGDKRLYPGVF